MADRKPVRKTPEDRDDAIKGPGYSDRCRYWESLTHEDIWSPQRQQPANATTTTEGGR